MTIFEEIQYTLTGRKPQRFTYDPNGRRIVISDEEDRWMLRLFIRMLMLFMLLLLLRLFGFIPSNWSELAQVVQVNRNTQSDSVNIPLNVDSGTGAGTNGSTNGSSNGTSGNSNSDGSLVFGSGDTSTNGQPGSGLIQGTNGLPGLKGDKGDTGPAGPAGPAGPQGATGAQGPAGQNGTNGTSSGVSSGQGAGAIGTCDDSVDVSLRSYWTGSQFKLDRILITNVSSGCNGLDLIVYLFDSSTPTPNELLNITINNVVVSSGTITVSRSSNSSVGQVVSNQIRSIAFELAQ